ncbi:hypothetical protein AXF42_Ash000876 [Apostasia shenzhenica]|uniref:OTU domain-containing protein n=1 Tax=Apostasia shenzhenica TaxID=1088818 RepID=A0A2I0ATA8_9ASPA|nr:hypothetical protein AXF42_Ash000876 [Apostasia shenzhenica]
MIMYEQDPDVLRWGFDLLNGDPFSTTGYCGVNSQNDDNFYDDIYVREGNFGADHTSLESDEILAHALQEEFSQLAVAEATGAANTGDEHFQASVLAQDWFVPSMRNFPSGHVDDGDSDDTEPSTSCSSAGEIPYDGHEWSLELTDDYSNIDGELGKRLNLLVPIPHVPRINGEIPSVDEATSDHQRLLDRLQLYDLIELKVQGDGNCQFRALSDQFYRTPEHHEFVRQQVINQYGVKIFVITSFKDTCYIEILPNIQRSKRVIFLSFWAEVHYNSIYPEGDLPAAEIKKKKRWWHFGNKH